MNFGMIWSAVTGFFGGIQTYLIVGAATALIAGAGGAYGGYRWELGAYNGLKAADATAQVKAEKNAAAKQKKIDDGNQADAEAEAFFQGQLSATVIGLKSGAPANVTITQDQEAAASDHAGCITYGFARMLYAAAHGVTTDSIPIPSDQSVDSCTAYEPSELATAVAQDLYAGFGNTHQLDALIGAANRNDALVTAPADGATK